MADPPFLDPDPIPDGPLIMGPEPVESDTPGTHVWGWMSSVELEWLRRSAEGMRQVVEVGSLRGRSAFALLTGCKGPVFCIDPWEDPGDHAYRGFMRACGHFPNLRAVRGRSPEAGALVKPRKVDMVFIDGEHDYDSVMADLAEWAPRARRLICGHDYTSLPPDYNGVLRAVTEVFGDRVRLAAPRTSIWAVRL